MFLQRSYRKLRHQRATETTFLNDLNMILSLTKNYRFLIILFSIIKQVHHAYTYSRSIGAFSKIAAIHSHT